MPSRRTVRSLGHALAGSLLATAVAACGTTVHATGVAASGGSLGSADVGAGADTSGSNLSVPGGSSSFSAQSASQQVAAATSKSVPVGTARQTLAQPSSHIGTRLSGTGYTATQAYVGIATYQGFDATAQAAGIEGLSTGDSVASTKLIFADINSRGGVLGRKLVPIFHDAPVTGDHASNAQAACSDFTQDHHVVAVVYMAANAMTGTVLRSCLAKHHTPLFNTALYPTDAKDEADFAPYGYNLSPAYERVFPSWLAGLDAHGYYGAWDATAGTPGAAPVKIGLVHAEQDPYGPLGKELKVALAERHHTVDEEAAFDATNVQTDEAGVQNAVLRFRSAGITHVFSLDAATMLLFMEAAEQQHFRPRYAMTSYHAPSVLLAQNVPEQMNGMTGIGWIPTTDVDKGHDPGSLGAAQAHCTKVLVQGGQSMDKRSEQVAGYIRCDMINLMADGIARAGSFDPTAIRVAVGGLGSAFQSATTFTTGLGPNVADIAGGGREFAWSTGCSCVVYLDKKTVHF